MSRQTDWRDTLRRIGWLDRIGVMGVLVVSLLAVLATWLAPYDPQLRVDAALLAPSAAHWFGTDEIGRDLFSRTLLGLQFTWLPALAVIGFSLVLGTFIGVVSGAAGGWIDLGLQRLVDLFLVLPSALVALAVVAALGPGLLNIMIALAIFWWPWYARIARDEIKRIAARPYVEAARLAGASPLRLVSRHMLAGALPALVIAATLDVANARQPYRRLVAPHHAGGRDHAHMPSRQSRWRCSAHRLSGSVRWRSTWFAGCLGSPSFFWP